MAISNLRSHRESLVPEMPSFIYVPMWLENKLKEKNLPLASVLDFSVLSNILIEDELKIYLLLNRISAFEEAPITNMSNGGIFPFLASRYEEMSGNDLNPVFDMLFQLKAEHESEYNPQTELLSIKLFYKLISNKYDYMRNSPFFAIHPVKDNIWAVTFDISEEELKSETVTNKSLYDACEKLLTEYDLHELARVPLFNLYTESLNSVALAS